MAMSPLDIGVPGSFSLEPLPPPRSLTPLLPGAATPIVSASFGVPVMDGVPATDPKLGVDPRGEPGAWVDCWGNTDGGAVREKSLRGEVDAPPRLPPPAGVIDSMSPLCSDSARGCAPFVGILPRPLLETRSARPRLSGLLPSVPFRSPRLGASTVTVVAPPETPPWLPRLTSLVLPTRTGACGTCGASGNNERVETAAASASTVRFEPVRDMVADNASPSSLVLSPSIQDERLVWTLGAPDMPPLLPFASPADPRELRPPPPTLLLPAALVC